MLTTAALENAFDGVHTSLEAVQVTARIRNATFSCLLTNSMTEGQATLWGRGEGYGGTLRAKISAMPSDAAAPIVDGERIEIQLPGSTDWTTYRMKNIRKPGNTIFQTELESEYVE